MVDETRIARLLYKRLRGTLTPPERAELDDWLRLDPSNETFMNEFLTPEAQNDIIENFLDTDYEAFHQKLTTDIIDATRLERPVRRWFTEHPIKTLSLAAFVMTFIIIGLLYFTVPRRPDIAPFAAAAVAPASAEDEKITIISDLRVDSLPTPGEAPCLYLDDGTRLYPEQMDIGTSVLRKDWKITRIDTNRLSYAHVPSEIKSQSPGRPTWNIFSTPFGKTWQLVLPDGSNTHLSTGTSLGYIVNAYLLPNQPRKAALRGQAWFDIKANKEHPYLIHTNQMNVAVLGTSFDLDDYSKGHSQATVLDGSLKIQHDNNAILLKAHQQIVFDKTQSIEPAPMVADNNTIAWRNHQIIYTHSTLRQVMAQVASWYGMDSVVFAPDVDPDSPGRLSGQRLDKSSSLETALEHINPGDLKFELNGKRITVKRLL